MRQANSQLGQYLNRHINGRKWLFGQKRRKVGRLQRQAARCFCHAGSVQRGAWHVVLIEKRPLTESERSSMNRAARSVGARRIRRQGRSNWIWHAPDEVARWLGNTSSSSSAFAKSWRRE